jgi:dTDP-4-amino-4,6-dideoxygalactose transaminase
MQSTPERIRRISVGPQALLRQALQVLEATHMEIVLVVDGAGRLLGTLTDGDIRRATLRGLGLDTPVSAAMSRAPVVSGPEAKRRELIDLMNQRGVHQLPLVDGGGVVVDVVLLSELMRLDVPLSDTCIEEEEIAAVSEVLRSGWLAMGELTQRFEREFAAFVGARYAVATTNGTAALHLAFQSLGIGAGDEVICPALSFVATSNAVLYTGAAPVFAEIKGEGDLTIDPEDVERRISPRTRAIAAMHYGGYPCDMPAILDLASRHGLAVVEDAAHAPGAALGGRRCGTWGELGCFSFFPNKNMTTGEGGMVTTDSGELDARLRLLRSHGMTSLTLDRHKGRAYGYDVVGLGYNYRMDEMRAALGLVQLRHLAAWNEQRRRLTALYRERLGSLPEVSMPFEDGAGTSACHILPLLLAEGIGREGVMRRMRERGVQTSVHYPAIHRFSFYRERFPVDLPRTEAIAGRVLTLPLFPAMKDSQVEHVVEVLGDALHPELAVR